MDWVNSGTDAASQLVFLDMRAPSLFARGFIPGSINVPSADCLRIFSSHPEYRHQDFYVIASSAVHRQGAKSSFGSYPDIRVMGWLRPEVLREWRRNRGELASFEDLEPHSLVTRMAASKTLVLDVRDPNLCTVLQLQDTLHAPVEKLRWSVGGLPRQTSLCLVCETGDRASFAASLLWRLGYRKLAILRGGIRAYAGCGLPTIQGVRANSS
jgi:hydroxyacylglutathione hydrolase